MTFIEKIVVLIIVLTLTLTLTLTLLVSNIGVSRGTHSGVVTAVETNGWIFVTDRAYFKTSTDSTQEDTYCVQDIEVYEDLVEAAAKGERVSISFTHPLVEWKWNCGGDNAIITSVIPTAI